MAQQNTTDLLTKINATGGLSNSQKDVLRAIVRGGPKIVRAAADHTVNVSTTYANHSELYFDVKAGRKYIVETNLLTTTDGTDGIRVQLNTTTDVTEGRAAWTYLAASSTVSVSQTDFTAATTAGAAAVVHRVSGYASLKPAADGRFYIQTALQVDNNAATTVHKGSTVTIYEVA